MQAIAPLTDLHFHQPVQRMRYRLEVLEGSTWVDVSATNCEETTPLSGWLYRKRIDIQTANLDANLTDFPLLVMLDEDADIGALCRADGYDIRFASANGTTLLPYERVSFSVTDDKATAEFWVRTDLATAGTYIYIYYGNAAATDGEDAEAVWDANFKAVYHMNDATTSTTEDSTGNDNDGTKKAANEPVEADGKIGKGQDFDGTDDGINCGNGASLNLTTMTIDLWAKVDYDNTFNTPIIKGVGGDPTFHNYSVFFYGAGSGQAGTWALFIGNGLAYQRITKNLFAYENLWTHVAYTVDGTHLKMFLNGVEQTGDQVAQTVTPASVGDALGIGEEVNGRFPIDGILDEIRISSTARSAAWIKFEYYNMNEADNELAWGEEEYFPPDCNDYLQSISISLGGAGDSPKPVAGTWHATIHNHNGIFHPYHPTSPYADLLRMGREVRISVGANYDGIDYYWQRLIGFMDSPRFDHGTRTVEIGGMDYMKLLADTSLRDVNTITESGSGSGSGATEGSIYGPMHWGTFTELSTVATAQTYGAELYDEADCLEIGAGEANNVANWVASDKVDFTSEAEVGGGSTWAAKLLRAETGYGASVTNVNVGAVTEGSAYRCTFKYCRVAAAGAMECYIYESGTSNVMGSIASLASDSWTTAAFQFTATATGNMQMTFRLTAPVPVNGYFWIDEVSIQNITDAGFNVGYELPEDCSGPYFVTLDGGAIWLGDPPEAYGWTYSEASRVIGFATASILADDQTLRVYYYTTQTVENVVADLMVVAGLYADRAAALADMDYTATGTTIERVWFNSGTTALGAVRMLCERVNYRFWLDHEGRPHFKPAPTAGAVAFAFGDPAQIKEAADYQDIDTVSNRVVIDGAKQAMFAPRDDQAMSKWTADVADEASILLYLEKTHHVENHLFQGQAVVDDMAAALLADYKDPRWYADLTLFANPVPLELGDTIYWLMELSPALAAALYGYATYGTGVYGDNTVLECEGIVRDIKLNDLETKYRVEVSSVTEYGGAAESGSASGSGS